MDHLSNTTSTWDPSTKTTKAKSLLLGNNVWGGPKKIPEYRHSTWAGYFENFVQFLYIHKYGNDKQFSCLWYWGCSQTTLTSYWLFWPPTRHFLPYKLWQKVNIFGLPTHLLMSTKIEFTVRYIHKTNNCPHFFCHTYFHWYVFLSKYIVCMH